MIIKIIIKINIKIIKMNNGMKIVKIVVIVLIIVWIVIITMNNC